MQIPKYSCGSDDITFCADACQNETCFRHPSNMIDTTRPHSLSNFKGTGICHDHKRDTKQMSLEMASACGVAASVVGLLDEQVSHAADADHLFVSSIGKTADGYKIRITVEVIND